MIYIAVAMKEEAGKIIEYYGLKKDSSVKKFQVFRNGDVTLFITGIGPINAMIATTHILSIEDIDLDDILVNIGIAGTGKKDIKIGDIVLANKVIDRNMDIEFYPDMVFAHPFKEGTLETFNHGCEDESELCGDIADMEGAGIVKAASYFMDSSQIEVIKVISDYLSFENPIDVDKLIGDAIPEIDRWLGNIREFLDERKSDYTEDEKHLIDKTVENLKLTQSMQSEFMTLVRYWKLSGKEVGKLLEGYGDMEIKNKKEVKRVFDEIRNKVVK